MQCKGWTYTTETLCCTIDARVLKSILTRWASNVQYHCCASCHLLSPFKTDASPQDSSATYCITMLYSPHITQHWEVCVCVKLRGPLLKQASQRKLPAPQSRPMHYSRSFTQPPISLSWVHHTFPTAYCTMKEPQHTVLKYINILQFNLT